MNDQRYRNGADQITETVSNISNNIGNSVRNVTDTVYEGANNIGNTIGNIKNNLSGSADNMKSSFSEVVNDFSAKGPIEASREFLDSNSIIAKFVFLILILIGFMFLINLGIYLIGYFTKINQNPYIVSGLISGNSPLVITQDPSSSSSVTIYRSNNRQNGIECTWSIWLLIANIKQNSVSSEYSHIFNKGDVNWDIDTGISTINNGPGLYLNNTNNTLRVVMDTMDNPAANSIDISNVPLQKWFHLAIRLQNNIIDTYINGTINTRTQFTNVPKQNYNNINICQNGGFMGNLSDLRYFASDLSVFEINNIVIAGPNMNSSKLTNNINSLGVPYYLSNIWYSNGSGNGITNT